VYRLGPLDASKETVAVNARWKLPEGLEAGKERKAEGLVFDGEDRPVVALDTKHEHDNAFLVQPLED
jgi:hypothetical protein